MKKILILLVMFSFVLSGCAGNNLGNSDQNNSSTGSGSSGKGIKNFEKPQDAPDIAGLVKNVIGNEVTILKIDMDNQNRGFSKDIDSKEFSEESKKTKALSLTGTGTMGGPGGGRMTGAGQRSQELDGDSRSAMLERIKEMSSGEEIVLIPVGIQMLKTDQNTGEVVNADLTDVTVDSMISIWLNEEVTDRKIAEFVLIR
jgi:hypothetical protein